MTRDPEKDKLVAPADFAGPTSERHCTDVLCLILLIAVWFAMTVVGLYAVANGDYRLVVNPLDYDGNVCGVDYQGVNMTDYSRLYYVSQFAGVCVKECPQLDGLVADNLTDIRTLVTYNGTFQPTPVTGIAELALDFVQVANYSGAEMALSCTDSSCYPNDSPPESWTSEGIRRGLGYAFYVADSYDVLQRCYLTTAAKARILEVVEAQDNTVDSSVQDTYEFFVRLYSDIWTARQYILGFGFGMSFALSFIYIFMMRIPFLLRFVIWTSILISIAMFFIGGYYTWKYAVDQENTDPNISQRELNVYKGSAVAMYVIGVLLIIMTICLRRAIQLAIGCVKEAGKAINAMPVILLVPCLQAVGLIAFMAVFVGYGINLVSLGDITSAEVPLDFQGQESIPYRTYQFSNAVKQMGWFLLFCLFWTSNFIVALGDMMVSTSVAKWYFTRNKWLIGSWTVLGSVFETIFYHAGTCAYGSLILAVIQMIRTIIAKFQKAAKDTGNRLASCILCCCQCCFWCLEKCIKFLNKNAYIQTAIFSTSFCTSAREAFFLILRNAARFTAVTYVSGAVLIVGKLFISAVTTYFGYYLINEDIADELYSVAGPVVLIFLISYWLSDFFMDVFDMGISTVLHCLIADEEMFDGDQQFADKSLQRYIDNFGG